MRNLRALDRWLAGDQLHVVDGRSSVPKRGGEMVTFRSPTQSPRHGAAHRAFIKAATVKPLEGLVWVFGEDGSLREHVSAA